MLFWVEYKSARIPNLRLTRALVLSVAEVVRSVLSDMQFSTILTVNILGSFRSVAIRWWSQWVALTSYILDCDPHSASRSKAGDMNMICGSRRSNGAK